MIPPSILIFILGYTISIVSPGSDFVDLTAEPWLDPGTISVTVNGDTVSFLPGARGASSGLVLEPAPLPGDTVHIAADTLPVTASKVVRLDMTPMSSGEACVLPEYRFGARAVPEGLYIAGTKKLGVSVGSGGGVSQGTELSIQGLLAPGITVDGRISDRDLPLGAASSEIISELDRMYVEVAGNSWSAEMGDLAWEETGPVPWRSEVSGFHGSVHPVEPLGISGGYGTTGSDRRRTVFLTEEGVQGPYSLAPEGGVTPGSEGPYLDGELLARGTGADYRIDYPAGMVTLNTSRFIRREQRVEITYYRQGDGFRKNMGRGGASFSFEEDYTLGFSGFSRVDDTGSPLGFVMTDEIEEVLRNAGEDPSMAWIDGGRFVGEGNGSYSLDSLSRYIWEGPGQGDWTVEFQKPPEGYGDYVYDSAAGGYLWAGEGLGTHLPRRYLTIPSSTGLAGLFLEGEGGFMESLSVHSSLSIRKGNLYDPVGTGREGTLSGGTAGFRPWGDGPLVTLSGRYVSQGFSPPDDMDTDRQLERWGLPPSWKGRDSFGEASVAGEALSISAGERFLEGGGTAALADASLDLQPGNMWITVYSSGLFRRGSPLLIPGDRGLFGADVSIEAGAFTPFLSPSFTGESWGDSLSGSLYSGDAGVVHQSGGWRSEISLGGEIDLRTGTGFPERTFRMAMSTRSSGVSWNTRGSVQHSTGWFTGGGTTSSEAVDLGYSGRFGGMWFYCDYDAGGYISREMDIVYTWVGQGNGNYSFDSGTGEYYPDPSGDYVQSFIPGQGDTRILEAALSGGFTWADSAGGAGVDGSFGLSASDPDDRLATYTLAGAFDTGAPGEWNGSISPYLAWDDGTMRRLTLRISGYDRREDYSGVGTTREYYRKLEAVPVLRPLENLETRFSGFTASRRRNLYGARVTAENGFSADPVILFPWGLDAGLKVSVENRREPDGLLDITGWGLEPHISLGAGGWTASGAFTSWYLPGEETIPVWFFEGRQGGWTLQPSVTLGRNLSRWFRLSAFYTGRKRTGSPWEQSGGLEGTVNF